MVGGRDRGRTCDPLLAKYSRKHYVDGPSSFILRLCTMVFPGIREQMDPSWTQVMTGGRRLEEGLPDRVSRLVLAS